MALSIRIEERGIDALEQTVGRKCGLRAFAERSVALLKKQCARLPLRAADVDVVQPVTVHVADRDRGPLGRQQVRQQRLALEGDPWVLPMSPIDAAGCSDVREYRRNCTPLALPEVV